jgi:hypothetical protein
MRDGAFSFCGARRFLNIPPCGCALFPRCHNCRSYRRFRRARVRPAFLAARERSVALRRRAARCAWRDNARCDAARRGSRSNARFVARERVRDGRFLARRPFRRSRFACFRVRREVVPRLGGDNFTPARLAFDKPMAMACLAERAPCSPSRICSISSRTNSPACVEGDLPSRASSRARSMVSCSGIVQGLRGQIPNWMRQLRVQ